MWKISSSSKYEARHFHSTTCTRFRSSHWNWIIPYLNNLPEKYNSTFTTINGMLFVTLEMVLMVAKDKSWTCEFINPCRNFFFQYLNPIQYKDSLHVIISCAYHLSHFIEFIFKLRGVFSVNLIA